MSDTAKQRFEMYLSHTSTYRNEDKREEFVCFIEQLLPGLVNAADTSLYNLTDANLWKDITTDGLPTCTEDERRRVSKLHEALRFWRAFLDSKYFLWNDREFERQLKREQKAKEKKTQPAAILDNAAPESDDAPDTEGGSRQLNVTKQERNPALRRKCLQIYGYMCQVCGINLQHAYGEMAKEFIEVHHLEPISTIDGVHEVDIKNSKHGMRPLCPTCHAMIHRAGADVKHPMPLAQFRALYRSLNPNAPTFPDDEQDS